MLLLIPLLPFLGFLANAGFGRRLSKRAAGAIACSAMLGSFAVAMAMVLRLIALPVDERAITQYVYRWITAGDFGVDVAFKLDPLSAVMLLVITGVGTLIHVYSTAYMRDEPDPSYARYFSYLNLFAAFMLVLVLGSNFLVMFVGWEGVGLCSYLLIGFWYEKRSASDAGKKAFIVNRIGDFGFILGLLLVYYQFGTLEFQAIARAVEPFGAETEFGALSLATLLLFVGATGKSAQIPLYVWLPDAMEGPTPVSALIHAATMVTAGVYMIGRNAVLFSHTPETLGIIAVIGAATAFLAGTIGLVQNDIKRVLAYSTVSQLGYMFLAMGVGAYAAGIFHLYTHAFFKALLFLGAGAVIHALAGEQDIRRMGGLKDVLPITYWTFLIGALAIAGVPGLAGFFSKDEILYRTYASGHTGLWALGLLTSLLTAVYMFRLLFLAFHGTSAHATSASSTPSGYDHGRHASAAHAHDAPRPMALALVVLAAGSIVGGYVGLPHALGGSNRFEQFLAPTFAAHAAEARGTADHALADDRASASTELRLMAVSSLVAIGGITIAWYFFWSNRDAANALAERFRGIRRVLENRYYVDEIYDAALVQPILIVSEEGLWKNVDARGIDSAVNGLGWAVNGGSELVRRIQSGSVRTYAASLLAGVVLVLGYYLWR
jgi:NADH-quinone oxidoreductase subunit L